MSSTTKVWIFFLVSSFALLLTGYSFGDRLGLFLSFLICCAFHGGIYYWGSQQILKNLECRRVLGPEPFGIFESFQSHFSKNRQPVPTLFLVDSEECIVMIIPMTYETPVVAISDWVLERLTPSERVSLYKLIFARLEIDNNVWALAANQLTNILVEIGEFLDSINPIRFVFAKKIPLFAPLTKLFAILILKLIYRRSLFTQIDERALALMANPYSTARVLDKIESFSQSRPAKIQDRNRHLYLVDPAGQKRKSFFNFHQLTKNRISNLIGYYPL